MATYAIGDVQGCREQLESLLDHINFDTSKDKLWFAGDLVNRGADSLGTLRLIYRLRESVVAVLGNHDLHLLAVNVDASRGTKKDNFYDIFDAEDKDLLLGWLQQCPLAYAEHGHLLVHAGVYPLWDVQMLLSYAREVEQVLQSEESDSFFRQMYGNKPERWSDNLQGIDRVRFITNALTRMRYCDDDNSLDMICKLPVAEAPDELIPWFNANNRKPISETILHGHWAALNASDVIDGVVSLDTGCVWGGRLSAWCIEEKRWYSVAGETRPESK
jgi:bis(5'-nucleosyl)-tetraphosphatase (symmetrical)